MLGIGSAGVRRQPTPCDAPARVDHVDRPGDGRGAGRVGRPGRGPRSRPGRFRVRCCPARSGLATGRGRRRGGPARLAAGRDRLVAPDGPDSVGAPAVAEAMRPRLSRCVCGRSTGSATSGSRRDDRGLGVSAATGGDRHAAARAVRARRRRPRSSFAAAVAIVGTPRDRCGVAIAARIAADLVAAGASVVSGLAVGIDGAAARRGGARRGHDGGGHRVGPRRHPSARPRPARGLDREPAARSVSELAPDITPSHGHLSAAQPDHQRPGRRDGRGRGAGRSGA